MLHALARHDLQVLMCPQRHCAVPRVDNGMVVVVGRNDAREGVASHHGNGVAGLFVQHGFPPIRIGGIGVQSASRINAVPWHAVDGYLRVIVILGTRVLGSPCTHQTRAHFHRGQCPLASENGECGMGLHIFFILQ